MKKKKSVLLLLSAIIGALYLAYSIFYWADANTGNPDIVTEIGAGLATALVFPHLICTGLAVLFNIIGWAMNHRGFSLAGAILYAVAMIMFPMYFMFVLVEVVLSFVGFARLKKINETNAAVESKTE